MRGSVIWKVRMVAIWLRYFWFAVPAAAVTLCLMVLLNGLGFWLSLALPAAAGGATFMGLAMMASATGT